MIYRALFFLLFFSLQSKAESLSIAYRPASGTNGYVANINFTYKMQDCFNDLHVGIQSQKNISPSEYIYKGQSYSASDLGLSSFSNAKVGLISQLDADLYDRSQRAGTVRMTNVIDHAGAGCYGQSYSVKKSISGFDGKAASKRLSDFSLRALSVVASTTDFNIESLIEKKLSAEKTEAKKLEQEAAAATGATKVASTNTSPKTATSPSTSTTSTNAQSTPQQKQSVDLQAMQKQMDARMAETDRVSKDVGQKAGQAAGYVGDAVSGMWNSGHGLGMGFMGQDQDSAFFLDIVFGLWDHAIEGYELPASFWAGTMVYVAYDLFGTKPTEGVPLTPGYDKFTRMQMGFNVINNSLATKEFRLVFGPTLNFIDTFGPTGKPNYELEMEVGTDVGLAMVNAGALFAFTYNLKSEVYGFHFVFKKTD